MPSPYPRPVIRPVYLPSDTSVDVPRLRTAFEVAAASNQWTDSQRNVRWSYLRRAADAAVAAGAAPADHLERALELLPTFAPPPDGASSVRKTLSVLLGRPLALKRRGHQLDHAIWQPLLDVLALRGGKSVRLANLDLVIRAAGFGGRAPQVMPTRHELVNAAMRIGMAQPTLREAVATYNAARGALVETCPASAAAFAPIIGSRPRVIGVEALPVEILGPLLRAEAVHDDPRLVPWMEILRVIGPVLHEELAAWHHDPRRGERPGVCTPGGVYGATRSLNRLVAGLVLAGRHALLRTLSLLDLWTPTEAPFRAEDAEDPLLRRLQERRGARVTPILHQPARVAFDALAPHNRRMANLPEDHDGGYNISVVRSVQNVWTITAGLYRQRLAKADPGQWLNVAQGYALTVDHFFDEMSAPAAEKNRTLMVDMISLPQLVCIGFPLLERRRQEARREWLRARAAAVTAGHVADGHPAVRRAYREYARWAEVRLAPGVYVADGLRGGNYRHGVLGVHYLVTFERDCDGRAIGVASVATRFTGAVDDAARTKVEEAKGHGVRRRRRRRRLNVRSSPDWRTPLVPPAALWEYLTEVALPRARDPKGPDPLPPNATVDDLVNARRFALFLSTRVKGKHAGRPMSMNLLSVGRVGYALWWVARHALGRDVTQEFEGLDRAGPFYRIFAGHCTRLLLATFWGKVMGDWDYAAMMTNDTPDVLKTEYADDQFAKWEAVGGDPTHFDHPKAYAPWMMAIREKRLAAVDLADPALPLPAATVALLGAWDVAEAAAARGRNRRQHAAGRIRRARPGTLPPSARVSVS